MRTDPLHRIYRLKVTIVALTSAGVGIGLQVLAAHIHDVPAIAWVGFLPLSEIGGTLLAAGLFGIAWDYFDGQDKETREDERLRRLLQESAPSFRDAVVRGFAVESEDLKRVATPELLDSIAGNVLALRLGDRKFAQEVYADIRDQAIRAPERWHDLNITIRLSSTNEKTEGSPRFVVTVKWEYTVIPSHETQRFACVSDRAEFQELVSEIPSTATWFMTPRPGYDASQRDAFELVQYTIDGTEKHIRRTERKTGQTYNVNLGHERIAAGKPARISYTYKTITPKAGHLLHFDIDQPTKGMSVTLDYSDTDISRVSVLDLIASTKHARIERTPVSVPGKSVTLSFDEWVFPRTGIAYTWTLVEEEEWKQMDRKQRQTRRRV